MGFHSISQTDTIYHTIPEFEFVNQDSFVVNNDSLSDVIYVADFFYTNCPSICPQVINQMIRIHDRFIENESLKLISFALDPKRDNVERLSEYAKNLDVNNEKWHFLTGDKDQLWTLAEEYLIGVSEDDEEPGGISHSGMIILIDKDGHIRSFADGTIKEDVNELMLDIDLLLDHGK